MQILVVNPNTSDLVLKYMMVSANQGTLTDTQLIAQMSLCDSLWTLESH